MHEVLAYLRRKRPDVHRRLDFHWTGDATPSLDHVSAVVFWLADPLRQWYPACYEEAVTLAEEARQRGLRLINPPESLSNCVKSVQARLWRNAGIETPPVERFESLVDLVDASGRFSFPLLVRGDEHHAQRGMRICRDHGELLEASRAGLPMPCAVSPLVDVRTGHRRSDQHSVYGRLYHKKRLIVAAGTIRTKHVFFSADPIVSANTFTFGQYKWRSRLGFARSLSLVENECVRCDLEYWSQGDAHRELMLRACDALGLQFAAIDYSDLADGSVILWEANPYFRLPKLRDIMLPKQRLAPQRIASYYDTIGDFLSGLADDPCAAGGRQETPDRLAA